VPAQGPALFVYRKYNDAGDATVITGDYCSVTTAFASRDESATTKLETEFCRYGISAAEV
jgi:hypothetical protein